MPISLTNKKKMRNALFIVIIIITLLTVRIGYIQFIWGPELSQMASSQQAQSRSITAKRGTIYDSTGKYILAVSSSVESVTVNPTNIAQENKEKVAKVLSEMFELDYEKVLKKVTKRSSIETIVRKVDKEKTDELRKWMEETGISTGINIDEDSKRYYPYGDLAAQVIGFCGSDNQGLDGIEAKYDEELKGKNGKIERQTNAAGESLGGEEYVAATDGNNLILTIDMTIQSIVEKYLEEACIDNVCTDGGSIIAMNPQNGDILAMATYPSYNLNTPYEPYTDEMKSAWDGMEQKEKTAALQGMWRNKAISDTYEPGSVFKLITASASLEEGIVTDIDAEGQFCCTGAIEVAGTRIKCWRYYRPHGSESLRQGLMNSCNPVFIGLGQKIGVTKYYEYLRKFGLFSKTGIKLPGEANSIFVKEEKAGPVELATISFGQRFEITPLQMITAVSSIANGGVYIKPRVVKSIQSSVTGEITEMPIETGEQIISKENAEKVLSMMNSVVSEGTGKNAQVAGYNVGGKTGTSEDGVNTGKYVTSFCGVAETDNPQIVLLITLYNPTGEGGHQGGGWFILSPHKKVYEGGHAMLKENIIGTNFIITNRDLISEFGVNSAVMLGELYGRMNYFRKINELKFGYFFATKDSIEKSTKLSAYNQRKATSILQTAGILNVKHIDIPPKTYYKINEEKLRYNLTKSKYISIKYIIKMYAFL